MHPSNVAMNVINNGRLFMWVDPFILSNMLDIKRRKKKQFFDFQLGRTVTSPRVFCLCVIC